MSNYVAAVAAIRATRDQKIAAAWADAEGQLAELRAECRSEILRLRAEGLTYDQIAERLGCGHATIWRVAHDDAAKRAGRPDEQPPHNRVIRARQRSVS